MRGEKHEEDEGDDHGNLGRIYCGTVAEEDNTRGENSRGEAVVLVVEVRRMIEEHVRGGVVRMNEDEGKGLMEVEK